MDGRQVYIEMAGNLVPITKSDDQMTLKVRSFHENRLHVLVRIRDIDDENTGRIYFMRSASTDRRDEDPQTPLCNLILRLPEPIKVDSRRTSKEDAAFIFVDDYGWWWM